jgi:hypothetical protein
MTTRRSQRLLPVISTLLCAALLAACSSKPAPAPAAPTTPPPAAPAKKKADYGGQYTKLWPISEEGPAIPGLEEHNVPQGLAYWAEQGWLLIASYSGTGGASTIMVIDARTGQFVKGLNLYEENGEKYTGHAGGIAVSGKNAWLSSSQKVYRIPLQELLDAPDKGKVTIADRFDTIVRSSFTTFAEGVLWVGEFYNMPDYPVDKTHRLSNNEPSTYYAWVVGYKLDTTTDLLPEGTTGKTPDYILSIPDKIQGMTVTADSVILSQSFGRTKDSALLKYKRPDMAVAPHTTVELNGKTVPVWFLDRKNLAPNLGLLPAPPMTEGVIHDGAGRLYVLFESGATEYRSSASNPMDHLRVIRLADWK